GSVLNQECGEKQGRFSEPISVELRTILHEVIPMRSVRLVPVCLPALALMAGVCASAQTSSGDWQKSYPVSGKASLTLSTGDASVEVRSCGECHAVRVEVEWRDRKPGDFNLNEFQSGDHVNFELKEKPHLGIHFSLG